MRLPQVFKGTNCGCNYNSGVFFMLLFTHVSTSKRSISAWISSLATISIKTTDSVQNFRTVTFGHILAKTLHFILASRETCFLIDR